MWFYQRRQFHFLRPGEKIREWRTTLLVQNVAWQYVLIKDFVFDFQRNLFAEFNEKTF
jgi:hypothetical protein